MRKLLLAGAAMLSGTMVFTSPVSAQLQTQNFAMPASAPAAGPAPLSAPSFGTQVQTWAGNPPLATGSITVRLNGRLTVFGSVATDSSKRPGLITTASGATPTPANTKQASYTVFEKVRLYPSFDGVAANGLRYGAVLEIMADNSVAPGGGINGSISASNRTRGNLYLFREFAYVGTNELGYLRYGATDGPLSTYLTGHAVNFNSGGWAGDLNFFSANTIPTWPFANVMAEYSTSKLVYLSPKFYETVDFGVSFEPNTGSVGYAQCNGTTAAASAANNFVATGCDAASSTSVLGETLRRRNTIEAALRARAALGPVGLAGTLGGATSGAVQYNGTSAVTRYDGLNLVNAGAQITYGGLAVGGNVMAGRFNGQWSLVPKQGRDGLGWVVGASYVIGPVIFGVQYFNYQSAGSWTPTTVGVARSRNELGFAAGSAVTVAPGAYLFLGYLYGQRHQPGVDFLTGVTNARTHNNTVAHGFTVGTQFRW